MDKRKTILFISHLSCLNGAERSLYTLIKGLKKEGRVLPILMAPGPGPLVEKIKALNVPVIITKYFFWIGSRKKCFVFRIVRIILNALVIGVLYRKTKDLKPDLIYTNTIATPVGAVVAGVLKIPHVWHIRESVIEGLNGQYDLGETASLKIINRLSKAVICNSKAIEKKLRLFKYWEKPTIVIYNGFDFPDTEQTDPAKKYHQCMGSGKEINLLIAGSIKPEKGQEDAIRAISVLSKKGYQIRLLIAGTGNKKYIAYLKSISDAGSILHRTKFLGYVTDIDSLYQMSAITLICSRNEAFGRTAVESLACGTPVIGTYSGGLREILQHKKTGLLYEPGNIDALAHNIETLLSDRALYIEVLSNGRAYVFNQFNAKNYITKIDRILQIVEQAGRVQ